jgi:hypothetical protein
VLCNALRPALQLTGAQYPVQYRTCAVRALPLPCPVLYCKCYTVGIYEEKQFFCITAGISYLPQHEARRTKGIINFDSPRAPYIFLFLRLVYAKTKKSPKAGNTAHIKLLYDSSPLLFNLQLTEASFGFGGLWPLRGRGAWWRYSMAGLGLFFHKNARALP